MKHGMSALRLNTQTILRLGRVQLPFYNISVINRSLATSEPTKKDVSENIKQLKDWDPIYKFDYINSLASFNRVKIYQIALTTLVLPASFAVPTILDPAVTGAIGITGAITLSLASHLFRNTIGFIYINKKNPDLVRFAHVTFWGGRKDVEMKIDEVVPFSSLPRSILDSKVSILQFNNGHPNMKLFYKPPFGGIINSEKFFHLFGDEF